MNPYEILGVNENDSMSTISQVYKQYVKLFHPDNKTLKISDDEKLGYMQNIKDAYKAIQAKRPKNTVNYPDINTEYGISADFTNKRTKLADNFNISKFNKEFDNVRNEDVKAGIEDPFSRGYNMFDYNKNYNDNQKVTAQTYSALPVHVLSKNDLARPEMNGDSIIEYVPEILEDHSNFTELGISSVSNFSTTLGGKSQLGGTDLMAVYGTNRENWEDSVKRDKKLYSKYYDTTDLKQKSEELINNRDKIYSLPRSKEIDEYEEQQKILQKTREIQRNNHLNKLNEYYSSRNIN